MAHTWYQIFPDETELHKAVPIGSLGLLRAGELRICLANTEKGLFAFSNACTHRQADLHEGWLNKYEEVVCPLHQYRFSIRNGEERSGHGCPDLKTYPIEIRADGVYIRI